MFKAYFKLNAYFTSSVDYDANLSNKQKVLWIRLQRFANTTSKANADLIQPYHNNLSF